MRIAPTERSWPQDRPVLFDVRSALLLDAHHRDAELTNAVFGWTDFSKVDLSNVKGLRTAQQQYASSIGIDTIYKSKGKIPEVFLRGCGVPENFITYMHSLVGEALQFYMGTRA